MGSDNSDDRFETAKAMLNYGFSTYKSYLPAVDMNLIKPVRVLNGKKEFAEVGFNGVKPILIKKGQERDITVSVDTCSDVCAPVLKGQTLGTVTVKLGNETLAEYPITSICDIEKLTLFDSFIKVTNYILNGETAYPEFLL
jgi:D-alanyl-D-alanine carboxypeptidase (penicillin-binding protein 5/6)